MRAFFAPSSLQVNGLDQLFIWQCVIMFFVRPLFIEEIFLVTFGANMREPPPPNISGYIFYYFLSIYVPQHLNAAFVFCLLIYNVEKYESYFSKMFAYIDI